MLRGLAIFLTIEPVVAFFKHIVLFELVFLFQRIKNLIFFRHKLYNVPLYLRRGRLTQRESATFTR